MTMRINDFLFWAWSGALVGAAFFSGGHAYAGTVDRPFFRANAAVVVIGASDSSENGGVAPVAVDFNLLDNVSSGTAADDLIAQDGYTTNFNTGVFNASSDGSASGYEFDIQNQTFGGAFVSSGPHQTLDANDAYTEFGLDDTTDVDLVTGNRTSRFLVASNTAFDIYAQASDLVATGDFAAFDYSNIRYRLRLNVTGGAGVWQWGGQAQSPVTGGGGLIGAVNDLNDMSAGPTKVFDGGRRTARARGTLIQHAVAFQSRYRIRGASGVINNYDLSMGVGELGATVTYTIYTP